MSNCPRLVLKSVINLQCCRAFQTTSVLSKDHYKLVIVGGGTGGAAASNKFGKLFGRENVAIIEPCDKHYYQPGFTLVGSGLKKLDWTHKPMHKVISSKCIRLNDSVAQFLPQQNQVVTSEGKEIEYDWLITAPGLQLRFDLVKGLPEALENNPKVCSNYSPNYVTKTYPAMENFKEGNAIFTFPNTPIKCAGAPQKICYIADAYFRKTGKRQKATIYYNTALPVIFGIKPYAESLMKVVERKGIKLNTRHALSEVMSDKNEAVFDILDADGKVLKKETFPFEMLHVGAPCSPVEALRTAPKDFVDAGGWLTVNQRTLQHDRYFNVFGMGDCTNLPTAKTAAAVAVQFDILQKNLRAVMRQNAPYKIYDGYASCPLVTEYGKCIMAEFGYDGVKLETFPIDQTKERWTMYYMKKEMMPFLYWTALVRGIWNGPRYIRKLLHLGFD